MEILENVFAQDPCLSRVLLQETSHDFEDGALPASIASEQAEHLVLPHCDVDTFQALRLILVELVIRIQHLNYFITNHLFLSYFLTSQF
jgi:hypothetical protein